MVVTDNRHATRKKKLAKTKFVYFKTLKGNEQTKKSEMGSFDNHINIRPLS